MSDLNAFRDAVLSRTVLSALIGQSVKLTKAGREYKGLCPNHQDRTPSFTVVDEKGFGHCFSCGFHVDAIDWMTRQMGLTYVEALRELGERVGLTLPERSPEARAKAERIAGIRPTLEAGRALYQETLAGSGAGAGAVRDWLQARGVTAELIADFQLGHAPGDGGLAGRGFNRRDLMDAGLIGRSEGGFYYPRFKDRVMIPVSDERGRIVAFGGRLLPGTKSDAAPKYVNSPASEVFDKGRTLYNLHRAMPYIRDARRAIVVEGYMDVIALASVGLGEAVAPMGTALTPDQLSRLWRSCQRPILMFDGDQAGQDAALKACATAMPGLGPGREIAIAVLDAGMDPDDLVQQGGRAAIDLVLSEARGVHDFVFRAVCAVRGIDLDAPNCDAAGADVSPEDRAGVWQVLDDLARSIAHDETRAQYLGIWRARYDAVFGHGSVPGALHALTYDDDTGEYAFPETEEASERRLHMIIREVLRLNADRRDLVARKRDVLAMAKAVGFDSKAINAVVRDIEADQEKREEHEAQWGLYRRVTGVRGPMNEVTLPNVIDARPRRSAGLSARRMEDAALLFAAQARLEHDGA